MYEYVYGEAPLSIEEPALNVEIDTQNNGGAVEIDFGDFSLDDEAGGNEVQLEVGDIDWGGIALADDSAEINAQIDFNIDIEESGIVVEAAGCSGGVARHEEAFTILDAPKYQGQFIDELYELEAFLKLRLFELSNAADKHQIMSLNAVENFADHDAKTILDFLGHVEVVIGASTNETLYHLHQIKHSPK